MFKKESRVTAITDSPDGKRENGKFINYGFLHKFIEM